jgi:hypothetical protein
VRANERTKLLATVKARFEQHAHRHAGIARESVLARLEDDTAALVAIGKREASGGEPEVIGREEDGSRIVFCDCASHTPARC